MAFDITKLDVVSRSEDGIDVTITHPATGEPLDIVIKVRGKHAEKFRRQLQKFVQDESRRSKSKPNQSVSEDEAAERIASILAANTIGWTGMMENGKEVPFTKENAMRIYTAYPIIRGQVWEAAADDANFTAY